MKRGVADEECPYGGGNAGQCVSVNMLSHHGELNLGHPLLVLDT